MRAPNALLRVLDILERAEGELRFLDYKFIWRPDAGYGY